MLNILREDTTIFLLSAVNLYLHPWLACCAAASLAVSMMLSSLILAVLSALTSLQAGKDAAIGVLTAGLLCAMSILVLFSEKKDILSHEENGGITRSDQDGIPLRPVEDSMEIHRVVDLCGDSIGTSDSEEKYLNEMI